MAGQTVAIDTTRKAAALADVLDAHVRLTGPGNEPIDQLSPAVSTGLVPAAACYAIPEWARSARKGAPLLWLWPANTWAEGPRPHEPRLAAAFAIAAAVDHLTREIPTPRPSLALVRNDGTTTQPALRSTTAPLDRLVVAVEQRRAGIVDGDGVDPARSLRPRIDDQLALPAACYLVPAELRAPSRTSVPLMWALPDETWIDYPDRLDELIEGIALLLATIELVDVTSTFRSRTARLAVIEGGAVRS